MTVFPFPGEASEQANIVPLLYRGWGMGNGGWDEGGEINFLPRFLCGGAEEANVTVVYQSRDLEQVGGRGRRRVLPPPLPISITRSPAQGAIAQWLAR